MPRAASSKACSMSLIAPSPSGRSSSRIASRFGSKRWRRSRRRSTVRPRRRGAAATQNLKIPHGQLLIFTEQLGHLLQAGMTLDESLGVLEKRLKHPRVQQMTSALHQSLIDGRSFSQALRDFPRIFPPLYLNMVGAGEASGALPDILSRVVEHLMQEKNLRDRVQQALIYPAFLALAGVGAYHHFHHFHGAAADQFHVANRRHFAAADAHSARRESSHCRLLVALHSRGPGV